MAIVNEYIKPMNLANLLTVIFNPNIFIKNVIKEIHKER